MKNGFEGNIEVSLPALFTALGTNTEVEDAEEVLRTASHIIETVSGVIFQADYRERFLKKSDAYWVQQAVLFQAVWLVEQPDALTRLSVNSMSQDGLSIHPTDGLSLVLAPMAKRALNNCSWAKSVTATVDTDTKRSGIDFLTNDDHAWEPLKAGN